MEELPKVAPQEAIRHFETKGFEIGFDWRDVWQGEHARAFTVAKAMSLDLLQLIRDAVQAALDSGETLKEFSDKLRPELEKRGWWGKRNMVDPATGEMKTVQLGSPRRLRVIFNTNLRTAYAAGRWERIQRTKQAFPFLRYVSVMDGRERPEHHAWHGTILPVDDPWWDTHYGPCDWGCRCTAQSLNLRQIERKGYKVTLEPKAFPLETYINKRSGEVSKLERGIGPGWSYNVGKSYLDALSPPPLGDDGSPFFTASSAGAVDEFLALFGGERIWHDAGGWPLAISRGWFRRADGRIVSGAGVTPAELAMILQQAQVIGWHWMEDGKGGKLIARRYIVESRGQVLALDVTRAGWRVLVADGTDEAEAGLTGIIRPS